MVALLDVNVLIALMDENHVHHAAAVDWLDEHVAGGWASCPITQNGCIRILSQPSYPNALGVSEAIGLLREATSTPYHRFIADSLSILHSTTVDHERLQSARQITDTYLLALAVAHGMRFVTLDRSVSTTAVPRANKQSLVML